MSGQQDEAQPARKKKTPEDGIALCLSGGGYRAMLFHVGALLRINEVGLLRKIKRISSVSGGSITAGTLGVNWSKLNFDNNGVADNLRSLLEEPVRKLASETIDAESIIIGLLTPGSIGDRIAKAYDRNIFKGATLQDLPDDSSGPRFVINASNIQSGALWRFSRPYMADYLVGMVKNPGVPLAVAVAASSAFPPVLSPFVLRLKDSDFDPESRSTLSRPPYTTKVVLSDGGVYDNLGQETAWKRYKTILVSDAGGRMQPEPRPKKDWARHSYRVFNVIDNQVRNLRKRQLIQAYMSSSDEHNGAYWGIRDDINDYTVPGSLSCSYDKTLELADTPTRLKKLEDKTQKQLINWGYAISDAVIRKYYDSNISKPGGMPYPDEIL
ncbi:patatin-like phospholipase family protein [Verrucomicrobiota bacterium]